MKTILIHGLGQNASAWEKTVSALPDTRFLLPEMSEFTGDGSWQELYRNFSAWLGMQGTQLCLCGLSLGAVLALNYAAEYPERVRSMLLIAPQFRMPKAMLRFQALLFRVMPEKSFAGAGLSKKQFITLTSDMAALDFTPALNRISCPVITACGDKDKANFRAARHLAELLPDGEFHPITGAGHEANTDAPEYIAKLISQIQTRG